MTSLVTLDAAAAALCMPLSSLRRWVAQRRLATVKIGRRVLVERAEIDRLVAAHRRPALD